MPASHQRLRTSPKPSGLWCSVSVTSAIASSTSCGACTGGKSGLAPASLTHHQASEPFAFVTINPVAHEFLLDRSEQAMQGYLSHRLPGGNFEDRGGFSAHIGFLMVVTSPDQLSLLFWSQHHLTGLSHDRVLLKDAFLQD